jgi:hypothetical protein
MKFNKDLVYFKEDEVFYDGIKLAITRQNIQDYTLQTDMSGESIIIYYYKKELQQIRDKQLEALLNDREGQDKVD